MTVNEIITNTLKPFGDPVAFGEYIPKNDKTKRDKYYTFNYTKIPADFADDAPAHERYLIQIHLYCPASYNSLQQAQDTQDALFESGFSWPEVVFSSYQDGQHIIFECEFAAGINYGNSND